MTDAEMKERFAKAKLASEKVRKEGKVLFAGFVELIGVSGLEDAPSIQLSEMHKAFMAGCVHLWSLLHDEVDDGVDEPTDSNLKMMELIQTELDQFTKLVFVKAQQEKGEQN